MVKCLPSLQKAKIGRMDLQHLIDTAWWSIPVSPELWRLEPGGSGIQVILDYIRKKGGNEPLYV